MFQIKNFLPQTLFGRSLLIIMVPVLLLQVLTVYLFFDRHWSRMTSRLAFAVAGEVAVIADSIENAEDRAKTLAAIQILAAKSLDLTVNFYPEREVQPVTDRPTWLKKLVIETFDRELAAQIRRPFTLRMVEDDKNVEINIKLKDGVLEVLCSQRRLYSSSSYIFLLWMAGISLLLTTAAAVFMRNQVRPIRRLAIAAERFGKGREVENFKPEGAREVRQAAQAFLTMQDRIKRQIAQRTTMLAGVSHDLRTPLTRLKLGLSLLPASSDTAALKDDIGAMERMITAYLDFARGEGQEKPAATDLSALLTRMVEAERRAGADVQADIAPGLVMTVRPLALERAVANVLGNARKYAQKMRLNAQATADDIRIVVEDNGPGIPPEKYDDVFRPFLRLDPARGLDAGGVGLGLTVALDIVQAHGGRIVLARSADMGGLKAEIVLPR